MERIGEISHGTLRSEDLIPCFLDKLEDVDPREANRIKREYKLALMHFEDFEIGDPLEEMAEKQFQEDAQWILEDLHDALNYVSLPFMYFGAHEGDGACFGWWIDEMAIHDAIHSEELKSVEDLADVSDQDRIDYDYILLVNDHGNMSLYVGDREVWAIV